MFCKIVKIARKAHKSFQIMHTFYCYNLLSLTYCFDYKNFNVLCCCRCCSCYCASGVAVVVGCCCCWRFVIVEVVDIVGEVGIVSIVNVVNMNTGTGTGKYCTI